MSIIITSVIFQIYFSNATGKLIQVKKVNEINLKETQRYYSIENYYVYKRYGSIFNNIYHSSGGRGSKGFKKLDIYFVCPIQSELTFNYKDALRVWYCSKYSTSISEKASEEEKDSCFNRFFRNTIIKINQESFADIKYFKNLPNSNDRIYFQKAIDKTEVLSDKSNILILLPQRTNFENRNKDKFLWIIISFSIGSIILLLLFASASFSLEYSKPELLQYKNELKVWIGYLIPKGSHFVTSIIIDLNIVVFIIMFCFSYDFSNDEIDNLIKWGINYKPATTQWEYWRLITNVFIHNNLFQLLLNITALFFVARFIEPIIGKFQLITIFLLTTIAGSLISIVWYDVYLGFGASSSIYGICGFMLIRAFFNKFTLDEKTIIKVSIFLIFFIITLIEGLYGLTDNAAQIGAFIFGILSGIIFFVFRKDEVDSLPSLE